MKLKLFITIAALLIALVTIASAQIEENIPVPDPNAQAPQGPPNQDQNVPDINAQGQGPNNQGPNNSPAPENTNAGVARISLIHGDVSTQRGDSGTTSAAALNAPLVAGDRISTGDKSRAELQLDYANIFRLGEHSEANIANLTHTQIQVQLGQGLATYTNFKNSEADVEIDTPNVSIRPARGDGSYRIQVNSADETQILVRRGDAEISTPQGSTHLAPGQFMTVKGTGNDTQYKIAGAPSRDDWDRWNEDRDHIIQNAQAWKNTNRYYTGSEDLDAYGNWVNVPDYGQVWQPTVGVDWAPYRAGRWVWEPYWGWTWVSYEPWGWAPYHYGRWFVYGGSWVWWPGPVYAQPFYRPIWAPAYVSFFGFGRGFGFGIGFGFGGGFGSIGWLPIGPCDRFFPWWGGYRSRFNTFGVGNYYSARGGFGPLHGGDRFSNLRLARVNDRVRGGLSTVGAGEFGHGRITARPVSRETFNGGRMMAGNVPVVPNRDSLRASDRPASSSASFRGAQSNFFTRNRPAGVPQSFDHEAAQVHNAIQRNGNFNSMAGRNNGNEGRTNTSMPARTGNNTFSDRRGVSGPSNDTARSTAGTSRPGNMNGPTERSTGSDVAGWHHFGGSSPASGRGNSGPGEMSTGRMNSGGSPTAQNRAGGWQNFPRSSQSEPSRGSSPQSGGYRQSSRPPLDMRQPIVTQRPNGGSPYGGYRGAPGGYPGGGYPGGYPGMSRPSGGYPGGGYPGVGRPSGGYPSGGRPSGGYSGGGRPSGGGGGGHPSGGGGGGHSSGGGSHGGGGGGGHHGR